QARFQIDALSRVRSFERVHVWGRDPGHARAAAEGIAALPSLPRGCDVTAVASVREAVEDAGVVVTATASREPLLLAEWLAPGASGGRRGRPEGGCGCDARASPAALRMRYRPDPPAAADLVVIGGGVVGAATAWHAARAGLRPVILEARPALCTLTTPVAAG